MIGDWGHRLSSRRVTSALLAFLLASCSNMIAPSPDGLVWLNGCDVGRVTQDGLALITRDDGFCPATLEVDDSGVIWGAGDASDVRLVAGNRWIRILQQVPTEEEDAGQVIDMAVATDGRVWLVAGRATGGERLTAELRSFNGEYWLTHRSATGQSFGFVSDRYEPPDRIIAALPGGRMALVTSAGLFLHRAYGGWIRVISGEFTTVASTPDGSLWFAGPSGVYVWGADDLKAWLDR